MGRLAPNIGILLALIVVISAGVFIVPNFTGALIYSKWSNETVAIGESTSLVDGNPLGGTTFELTQGFDSDVEIIEENDTNRLLWEYDFGTNFNLKQPAQLTVKLLGINMSNNEYIYIGIYNYFTGFWERINQTITHTWENITTTLSWQNRNLSNYISSSGRMNISVEDDGTSTTASQLRLNYLAINATFSPLFNNQTSISNATGTTYFRK